MQAATEGQAETKGSGRSKGQNEALEPILAMLPSAVHGKENMLYMAGATLRSLRTGTAYLNYVGTSGMVSTLFTVPPIFIQPLPTEAFNALRDRILAASGTALQIADTLASIAAREQELLARCKQSAVVREPSKAKPTTVPVKGKRHW
jgi:hypothetical protein